MILLSGFPSQTSLLSKSEAFNKNSSHWEEIFSLGSSVAVILRIEKFSWVGWWWDCWTCNLNHFNKQMLKDCVPPSFYASSLRLENNLNIVVSASIISVSATCGWTSTSLAGDRKQYFICIKSHPNLLHPAQWRCKVNYFKQISDLFSSNQMNELSK